MTKIHVPLAALALGVMLSANKCADAKGGAAAADATTALAQGKWALQTLNGKEFQLPEGVEPPSLTLDPKEGGLTGFGGCNRLMGSVKVDGNAISFPNLGSTKMYCENSQKVEDEFKTALRAANGYTLKGDKLTLLDKGKEVATLLHVK